MKKSSKKAPPTARFFVAVSLVLSLSAIFTDATARNETPVSDYMLHPRPEAPGKPLFAVKTNLLFDAVTLFNVEIEVPLTDRWSVASEWIFPWWLYEVRQVAIETGIGFVEGRYWLGNRAALPRMTGWFAGVNFGAGYYDIGLGLDKGFQGELITAGLSGGFAHTINPTGTLRMEYSLGVGYMGTKYRQYDPARSTGEDCSEKWCLNYRGRGRVDWFGPTRAKVSLVWMINGK